MPMLMFRAANERDNQILEAHVHAALVRDEWTAEGQVMRRFHDLKLVREYSPVFALTMTIMHQLDEGSPLYGAIAQTLTASNADAIITLTGIDDTFAQTVYARHSYIAGEIHWNRRFADIIGSTADGRRAINFNRFHNTEPVDPAPRPLQPRRGSDQASDGGETSWVRITASDTASTSSRRTLYPHSTATWRSTA